MTQVAVEIIELSKKENTSGKVTRNVTVVGRASSVVNEEFFEFDFEYSGFFGESSSMLDIYLESNAIRIYRIRKKLKEDTLVDYIDAIINENKVS